jgi:hypothetical protein
MKELFRERALSRVSYYQSLLEAEGIPTFMKNENVSVMEGVSIPEFFPALCVVNDQDYDAAVGLIKADLSRSENCSTEEMACGSCGELSPVNFDTCWNCQSQLPHSEQQDQQATPDTRE